MSRRLLLVSTALIVSFLAAVDFAFAQATTDRRLFERRCTTCHGNPSGPAGGPDGLQLRTMTPEAMTTIQV